MTPSLAPCDHCYAIARDLGRGEVYTCPFCLGVLDRPADRSGNDQRRTSPPVPQTHPAPRQRPASDRDGWLSLLRDCRLIARWDSLASAPSPPLPVPPMRFDAPTEAPTAMPGGGSPGGARLDLTDRPDWASGAWVSAASRMRNRLTLLWTIGRAQNVAALQSAGVIEFLVPRARVLLDSAGESGTPIQRDLPQIVGWAHTTDRQREKWIKAGMRADGARRHGVELLDVAVREWEEVG